jgi:fibronectin-binding autotransporter adhesin
VRRILVGICGAVLASVALVGQATGRADAGPALVSAPTVTGVLQQGGRLTAGPGTWSSTGAIAYAYQWYRCNADGAKCSSVHGATRGTYTLVAKDVGRTLGLTVRGTDSSGTTSAYAALAGLVAPAKAPVVATAQPALTGSPIVGQALQVGPATWRGTSAAPTVTWRRCNANGRVCAPVAGATAPNYTVTAADAGHVLVAAVTASKQTVFSLGVVARAAPGPVSTERPSIAGTLQQGKQLTGNAGTWTGTGTIAYAYQWYRCDANGAHCSSIHGATRPTYTQVAADVTRTIGLTVKATDTTGTTAAYSSLAGVVVPPAAFAATAQPSLGGAPAVGQQLKVSGGTFTQTPSGATYAWLRCNANGRLCTAIANAAADTYVVTADDAGHALVALVTATAGTAKAAVLTTSLAIPGA